MHYHFNRYDSYVTLTSNLPTLTSLIGVSVNKLNHEAEALLSNIFNCVKMGSAIFQEFLRHKFIKFGIVFFGKLKTPKSHFEINWPLRCLKFRHTTVRLSYGRNLNGLGFKLWYRFDWSLGMSGNGNTRNWRIDNGSSPWNCQRMQGSQLGKPPSLITHSPHYS